MLRNVIRNMFNDANRGDDRVSVSAECIYSSDKPSFLRRRTIKLIAISGILIILYVTLLPFHISPERSFSWNLLWHGPESGDAIANVLVYIPIGFFLRLLFRRRNSSWFSECFLSTLVAGSLAYLTEVSQTVVAMRVPSWMDTICNFAGALIGISFAPVLQRVLRNLHAWIFHTLRTRPLHAAATAAFICLSIHALMPFDFYPSPKHITDSFNNLLSSPPMMIWTPTSQENYLISPRQTVDKIISAGSYGLLAFILLLSAREAHRSLPASIRYAFVRSAALAVAIESVQFFTISHVADLRDLFSAWLCCGLGTTVGWISVYFQPAIHKQPTAVLRGIVAAAAFTMVAWSTASLLLQEGQNSAASISWVPLVNNFHRPWNSVLGDITTGFLQYALIAGLLVLWYRSTGRPPRVALIIGGTLTVALLLLAAHALYRQSVLDTAQLLLALAAGLMAVRLDRAIFSKKQIQPALTP